jgi:hypothetical protein
MIVERYDRFWFKDAIVYALHVKTFFDGNGDGIGDLSGGGTVRPASCLRRDSRPLLSWHLEPGSVLSDILHDLDALRVSIGPCMLRLEPHACRCAASRPLDSVRLIRRLEASKYLMPLVPERSRMHLNL